MAETLDSLLKGNGTAPALQGVAGPAITRAQLTEIVGTLARQLQYLGIARTDAVALRLPNGPALAAMLLAVMRVGSAAPLNPKLTTEEIAQECTDYGVRFIVVEPGTAPGPPGTRTLELVADDRGAFALLERGKPVPYGDDPLPAREDDVALLLHTSGTTARPKTVPLTHANLMASVSNIGATLHLGTEDTSLVLMPLFHIHGIVASLFGPLAAGGAVAIPQGFNAFTVASEFQAFQPTWYSAVPTMHQAILGRLGRSGAAAFGPRLRFIRSSSAALPVAVLSELEAAASVPVIEAYGMTEAAHQVTSNPLPPGERKPGSVGQGGPVGVRVLAPDGQAASIGTHGEVALRGANVISGYRDNPGSFRDSWFLTGDQGYLDDDGYLFLTGRLKELINRGGEKISPYEVEAVLLAHPSVAQAAVFAVPHTLLGEDVAAAIVLSDGESVSEAALRAHAASLTAAFKVPRLIIFLDALPLGPTGKLQRGAMARTLGLQ